MPNYTWCWVAIETEFGWGLAGKASDVMTHFCVISCDDRLRRFWEIEEFSSEDLVLTMEEMVALNHFKTNHPPHTESGRGSSSLSPGILKYNRLVNLDL